MSFSFYGSDLTASVVIVQYLSILTHAAGGAICHTGDTVRNRTDCKRERTASQSYESLGLHMYYEWIRTQVDYAF